MLARRADEWIAALLWDHLVTASVRHRAIAGVQWTAGAKAVQQIVQIVLSLVLMRLLGPDAFGLIAMVTVFSGFAGVISEFGLASAIVQRANLDESHSSTAFWFTLCAGVGLTVLVAALAPLVARFYGLPELERLTMGVALTFVLTAPSIVPKALLQRTLNFRALACIEVGSAVGAGAVALVVVLMGGGVWGLVARSVLAGAIASCLALVLGSWRPRATWSRSAFQDLARYGAGLTGFAVVNYWARSADNLLIGRFLGSAALGLYSRAYFLMLTPIRQLSGVLAPVMLPLLSSIQDDQERVGRVYCQALRLMTFIAFPIMFGLAAAAPTIVTAVLGDQWIGAIRPIQILAMVGVIQSVCNPVGWIYTSQGRTDLLFAWGVIGGGFLIVSIVVGVAWGSVEAVAWAYLIGNIIVVVPCNAVPARLVQLPLATVFKAVAGNLFCAAGMAVAVWLSSLVLAESIQSAWARLVLLLGVGIAVYLLLAALTGVAAATELYAWWAGIRKRLTWRYDASPTA